MAKSNVRVDKENKGKKDRDIGDSPNKAFKVKDKDFSTAYDPNVENSTIVPYVKIESVIDPVNDIDFIRFDAKAGNTITLDIDFGAGDASSVDTVVTLFDKKGNYLAFNDDGGIFDPGSQSSFGLDSYLQFVAPETGTYYVAVSSYSNFYDPVTGTWSNTGGSAGDYTLNISVGNPPSVM